MARHIQIQIAFLLRYDSHVACVRVLGACAGHTNPGFGSKFQCKLFTTTAMRSLRDTSFLRYYKPRLENLDVTKIQISYTKAHRITP